jgi:hypothetical protein
MTFSFLVSPQPSLSKVQRGWSSHDLVSHATVRSRADVLFGVKVIWEIRDRFGSPRRVPFNTADQATFSRIIDQL